MESEQTIAVDPNTDDDYSSSGYETDGSDFTLNSTATLKSSIYDYRFENGRRYHAYRDGKYMLPNDDTEQERLDIIHHTYLLLLEGKLHLAPIGPNPTRILDVGTGTGIWAIDAGEQYPDAEVIGIDLSPIQPAWVPPNVHFQIDDAESEWTWTKGSFDLIHIRHLGGAIKDWDTLLAEVYKHLKPGGYVDIAEYEMNLFSDDGTFHNGLGLWKFYDMINEAADSVGRGFGIATQLKFIIERAGFVNIKHDLMKLPLGIWPADQKQKILGAYVLITTESAFEAVGMRFLTVVLGMSLEDATALVVEAKKDAHNRQIHSYAKQHFYYGMKPLDQSPIG